MEVKDLFLTPIYLSIIYFFAYLYRQKFLSWNKHYKRYFIPALTVKIFSAIILGLVYQYYYDGGDTYNYFHDSRVIWNAFKDNPFLGLKLIFWESGDYSIDNGRYTMQMFFFRDQASYFIVRIAAFLSLFCFNTYSVIAIFFAVLSFTGIWKLYVTFNELQPGMEKKFAIATLFLPSVVFWGSGLLKDGITLSALGWWFYSLRNLLITRRVNVSNITLLIISLFIITKVKIYVILCFMPSVLFWVFNEYNNRIKLKSIKFFFKPLFIAVGIGVGYLTSMLLAQENAKYAFENIVETANTTAQYIHHISVSQGGSAYSLNAKFDGSLGSLLMVAPQAIEVTLFRPYLWEVKNVVMLFAALESVFILIFTIIIFFRLVIQSTYKKISITPMFWFCLIFALMFAVAVGLSSYNFGALVRYKIPMMPFYVIALYILDKNNPRRSHI